MVTMALQESKASPGQRVPPVSRVFLEGRANEENLAGPSARQTGHQENRDPGDMTDSRDCQASRAKLASRELLVLLESKANQAFRVCRAWTARMASLVCLGSKALTDFRACQVSLE